MFSQALQKISGNTTNTTSILTWLVNSGFITLATGSIGSATATYTVNTLFKNLLNNLGVINTTLITTGLFSGNYTGTLNLPNLVTYLAPTIQRFTTGTGTYTLNTTMPRLPVYIRIRMVGGGGGGGGSVGGSGSGATNGGNGGPTTFGTNLTCFAGSGGPAASPGGGSGGSTSITDTTGQSILVTFSGSVGGGGLITVVSNADSFGGSGGASGFGSFTPTAVYPNQGTSAPANSGCGGAGGGPASNIAQQAGGGGGGAGGYIEAIIKAPVATYAYSIGIGGSIGFAGAGGTTGGLGGSGLIIVEEFYQ
jgi:hypothetical protein